MSDTGGANGNGSTPSAPEGVTQPQGDATQVTVQVNAQYVKDLSFENPGIAKMLAGERSQPQIGINLSVGVNGMGKDRYECSLTIKVEGKHQDATAFIAELAYGGLFTVRGLPQEHLTPFLYIECPRLLFPFARAILSDVIRDGGFPPLLLNPIDFAELFRRQQQQQQAGQQAGAIKSEG